MPMNDKTSVTVLSQASLSLTMYVITVKYKCVLHRMNTLRIWPWALAHTLSNKCVIPDSIKIKIVKQDDPKIVISWKI